MNSLDQAVYKNQERRNSNLELLRIVSMLLIIIHHYTIHGGFELLGQPLTVNKIIIQILSLGGKIGVNCFILITGYFLVDSIFKFKKLIKLLVEILFYSILIAIIFWGFKISEFNTEIILKSIFPITFNMYWFATTYVVLYIFMPFINSFIKNLKKKDYIKLITILIIMWSVIPTFTTGSINYSDLGWFFTLYVISAYIKMYPCIYFKTCQINLFLSITTFITVIFSVIIFDIIGISINVFSQNAMYFNDMSKLPMFICSITLFLFFLNLKMQKNKIINNIAKSMFGIYLIHDNILVRSFIWEKVFKNRMFINSPFLILHAFITIIIVFSLCLLIDQIRIYFIEKPLFLFVDRKEVIIITYFINCKMRILKIVKKLIASIYKNVSQ